MEDFEYRFAEVAALLGDRSRSVMLWNLLDGRAYTASEFAICANISAQSASNHLSKMVDAKILAVEKQGRHRYFRYASPEIAQVIESMASLVAVGKDNISMRRPGQSEFTYARTCYDHLAGKFGVDLTMALIANDIIRQNDKLYEISSFGTVWLQKIGINVEALKCKRRLLAGPCLDWSERKHHLAGALGAALLDLFLEKDWVRRKQNSRTIIITSLGKIELGNLLDLDCK